jgi:hypothetical protein
MIKEFEQTYAQVSSAKLMSTDRLKLTKLSEAPVSPQDGEIFYADGAGWDPGSGAGIYHYNSSVYTKL